MKNILLLCSLIGAINAFSGDLKKANNLFTHHYYQEALIIYETEQSLNQAEQIRKAFCYYATHNYEKAENLYQEAFTKVGPVDSVTYVYANILFIRGNFIKAKETLLQYQNKDYSEYKILLQKINWAEENKGLVSKGVVSSTNLVSNGNNFGVCFTGSSAFSSLKIVNPKNNSYRYVLAETTKTSDTQFGSLQEVVIENTGSFKGGFYIGNPTFDGGTIYFTTNYSKEMEYTKNTTGINSKGENRLKIVMGDYSSGTIKNVREFEHNNNAYDFMSPFILGNELYFSSNMPGGFGGFDLYVSRKQNDGSWSTPKNMGEKINSEGNEMFPYKSGAHFFFSSDGWPGYGGADIFCTSEFESTYNKAMNLGVGVNSPADDFGIIVSGNKAHLISNRNNNLNLDNVWFLDGFSVSRNQNTNGRNTITDVITGLDKVVVTEENGKQTVYDVKNENGSIPYETPFTGRYSVQYVKDGYKPVSYDQNKFPADNAVELVDMDPNYKGEVYDMITGEPVQAVGVRAENKYTGHIYASTETDPFGKWWLAAPDNDSVQIVFEKANYKTTIIPGKGNTEKVVMTSMVPETKKGNKIEIRNIYFDLDKATIKPESFEILDNIFTFLMTNPEVRVELSAHTDSRGGDAYNLSLSTKRAKAAYDYLVTKGVPASRMIPKGYGEKQPVNECTNGVDCPEESHAVNRRVELKIL